MNSTAAIFHKNWTTLAVTPLPPGWIAAFKDSNGALFTNPVPAVLLEECRQTERWSDGELKAVRDEGAPYETRVVAATFDGFDLVPLDYVGNFVGIYGPGEDVTA